MSHTSFRITMSWAFCELVKAAMRKSYTRGDALQMAPHRPTSIDHFRLDQVLKESEGALPRSEAGCGTQHEQKTDATRQEKRDSTASEVGLQGKRNEATRQELEVMPGPQWGRLKTKAS